MANYSPAIQQMFGQHGFLRELFPKESLFWKASDEFRRMDEKELLGGREVTDPKHLALLKGALWCGLDELDTAHRIFQDEPSELGSYWHGIMHRREGDLDNARYWFRRAGKLPVFNKLHEAAAPHSPNMRRQETWDPYLFVGLCEQVRHGDTDLLEECRHLQRQEFAVLFAYSWEKGVR